tara:strand:- start:397 stop:651 length:255 start_codon:yes stop_codon:yes gene_type:complete
MMLTVDEYMALRRLIDSERESEGAKEAMETKPTATPRKRRASAYSRKYKAAFRRIASTYKNKNGTWRKGGFRKAVKAAHKAVKK